MAAHCTLAVDAWPAHHAGSVEISCGPSAPAPDRQAARNGEHAAVPEPSAGQALVSSPASSPAGGRRGKRGAATLPCPLPPEPSQRMGGARAGRTRGRMVDAVTAREAVWRAPRRRRHKGESPSRPIWRLIHGPSLPGRSTTSPCTIKHCEAAAANTLMGVAICIARRAWNVAPRRSTVVRRSRTCIPFGHRLLPACLTRHRDLRSSRSLASLCAAHHRPAGPFQALISSPTTASRPTPTGLNRSQGQLQAAYFRHRRTRGAGKPLGQARPSGQRCLPVPLIGTLCLGGMARDAARQSIFTSAHAMPCGPV